MNDLSLNETSYTIKIDLLQILKVAGMSNNL